MKLNKLVLGVLLIALAGILVFSGCVSNGAFGTTQEEQIVKMGFVMPLSGDLGMYGQSIRAAIEYAAEKSDWKINGQKVEFIFEDGKCNGQDATNAFNKLVEVDNVKYIFGGACSSETLAGAPIVNANKVISISSGSSSPELRNVGGYVFTLYPLDDFEGKFAAEYIYNVLKVKNVAILAEQNDWAKGEELMFKKSFEALGGKVLLVEHNEQDAKDVKAQLIKIKNANPELVFAPQYSVSMVTMFLQAKEIGLDVKFFCPQFADAGVVEKVGNAANGSYTSKAKAIMKDPNFESEIRKRTGMENADTTVFSPKAYDSFMMIKTAVENAGTFDTEKVREELLDLEYNGLAGSYKFDEMGTPSIASYIVQKVINEQLVEQ